VETVIVSIVDAISVSSVADCLDAEDAEEEADDRLAAEREEASLLPDEFKGLLKPGSSAVCDPTVKNLLTHSSCVNSSLD